MQSRPHPGIVDFASQRVQVVVSALGLHDLRHGALRRPDRPPNLVSAEERGDGICDCGGPECMSRWVLGMVDGQQRNPGWIGVRGEIAVAVCTGNRRSGPPRRIVVLCLETETTASAAAVCTIANKPAVSSILRLRELAKPIRFRFQWTYGCSAQKYAMSVCSGDRSLLSSRP